MNKDTVILVNHLIQISLDGKQGFLDAAEQIQGENFKSLLQQKAEGCELAAHELQKFLLEHKQTDLNNIENEEIEDIGTILGSLHRGWMNIKSTLTNHDDYAILAECERGEDVAKEAYSKALEDQELPSDLRMLIEKQYDGVLQNHDEIRDLRNAVE